MGDRKKMVWIDPSHQDVSQFKSVIFGDVRSIPPAVEFVNRYVGLVKEFKCLFLPDPAREGELMVAPMTPDETGQPDTFFRLLKEARVYLGETDDTLFAELVGDSDFEEIPAVANRFQTLGGSDE